MSRDRARQSLGREPAAFLLRPAMRNRLIGALPLLILAIVVLAIAAVVRWWTKKDSG